MLDEQVTTAPPPGREDVTRDRPAAREHERAAPASPSALSTQHSALTVLAADPVGTGLIALTGLAMMVALYAIFVFAPTERVMGHVQRIFYVHVSLAWLSYLAFL